MLWMMRAPRCCQHDWMVTVGDLSAGLVQDGVDAAHAGDAGWLRARGER
jgi:hypothetical protein